MSKPDYSTEPKLRKSEVDKIQEMFSAFNREIDDIKKSKNKQGDFTYTVLFKSYPFYDRIILNQDFKIIAL